MIDPLSRRDVLKVGVAGTLASSTATRALANAAPISAELAFKRPPMASRPWVYWYFMDGHLSRSGMAADLDAMKSAGLGGAIFLEVGLGLPSGPVPFMSETWQQLVAGAFQRANSLGLSISLGTGPGWCGAGGPWIKPEESMQNLVSASTEVAGPADIDIQLNQPKPRVPFFGLETLNPDLHNLWRDFYRDVIVLAFPTQTGQALISDIDEKALYTRGSFSSQILGPFTRRPWVRPYLLPAPFNVHSTLPEGIPAASVLDLTSFMESSGRLRWTAPYGRWTVLRFGRTVTAQTTRPAPVPGIGFESDKFSRTAIDDHIRSYLSPLIKRIGTDNRSGEGLTAIHFDSWEMGSQNWSERFAEEFAARRGYAVRPFLPTFTGAVVESRNRSERFLWDVRRTAQELVIAYQVGRLQEWGAASGLKLEIEPYDLNFTSDMALGSIADVPMGEFWSKGYVNSSELNIATDYSIVEATSIAHTNGRRVVAAESFTALSSDLWLQHPASMKAQADWALCAGINRIVFHRFQAQSEPARLPGMTMGPAGGFGVHWDRTQTFWPMVKGFHDYLARCQDVLRRGLFVADILYVVPEGAPNVFLPPASAFQPGEFSDRRGYNFDGCAPETLIAAATVRDGHIVFPDGMSYRLIVLPRLETMTPELLAKVAELLRAGAQVLGQPPLASPSLVNYPECDRTVARKATEIWGQNGAARSVRVGQGRLWRDFGPPVTEALSYPIAAADWLESLDSGNQLSLSHDLDVTDPTELDSVEVMVGSSAPFKMTINGLIAGSGINQAVVRRIEISAYLKAGRNSIVIQAEHAAGSHDKGPVRGIAGLRLIDQNGRVEDRVADLSWATSGERLRVLAPFASGLGGVDDRAIEASSLYPGYATAAKILKQMNVPEDFESSASLRVIHRREADRDYYFIANREAREIAVDMQFRVAGKRHIEWWNPLNGDMRQLPRSWQDGKRTVVPLMLPAHGSGILVFLSRSSIKPAPAQNGENFPAHTPVRAIVESWRVAFDPALGGPTESTFNNLTDWRTNSDKTIRYYSGRATYKTNFALNAAQSESARELSLGEVANIASVRLNGEEIGVAWCWPWQLSIPANLLREGQNTIEITVANLWINRLIADSGKAQSERVTWTPDDLPLNPADELHRSGLLGPVVLLK